MPSVDVDVEPPRYAIAFSIPTVQATATMTGYNRSSGGCDDFDIPTTGGSFPSEIPGSDGIRVEGAMKPKDRYLGGSQAFNLAPPVAAGGVKTSHQLTVYWHLHKID